MVIRRIQTLITLGSIAPLVVLGVATIALLGGSRYLELEELIAERGRVATSVLEATSQYGLLTGSAEELVRVARNALLLPSVRHVIIYNTMREPVASVGTPVDIGHSTYTVHKEVVVPVSPESSTGGMVTIGAVEVQIDTTALVEKQNAALGLATAGLLLMIGFSVFASSKIATGIVRPIARLIQATKDVAEGRPTVIAETADNELRELEHGFNHMAKAITEHRLFLEEEVHAATMNLLQANQELQQKNKALEEAREREIQRRIAEFIAFQEGANALRAGLLHNIGNVIAGIVSRAEAIELITDELDEICALLNSTEAKRSTSAQTLKNLLEATAHELADIAKERIKPHAAAVYQAGAHIGELIHIQRTIGHHAEQPEEFVVSEMINDAITITGGVIRGQQTKVHVIMPPTALKIRFPRNEMLQALINILKNAIESVQERYPPDGKNGMILIKMMPVEEGRFAIDVHDNGVGFTNGAEVNLFRFGYTTKVNGSGLGLHSAANFVQLAGGTISASSEGKNKGAVIHIVLPILARRISPLEEISPIP